MPRMKPASVFPMPVANWPKAPALQVCESVPNSTSPAKADCTCQYCCTVLVRCYTKLVISNCWSRRQQSISRLSAATQSCSTEVLKHLSTGPHHTGVLWPILINS